MSGDSARIPARKPSLQLATAFVPVEDKRNNKKKGKQQGSIPITKELILHLIDLVNQLFEECECKGLPLIRIKNNKFLVGTQCLKLMVDPGDEANQVYIVEDLKLNGQIFHDYLVQRRETEVDTIVATMGKTGLSFPKLVQHYLKNNGASDKIIDDVEKKLNVEEWNLLMEECGYRLC
jgi:hypothetical protein